MAASTTNASAGIYVVSSCVQIYTSLYTRLILKISMHNTKIGCHNACVHITWLIGHAFCADCKGVYTLQLVSAMLASKAKEKILYCYNISKEC